MEAKTKDILLCQLLLLKSSRLKVNIYKTENDTVDKSFSAVVRHNNKLLY